MAAAGWNTAASAGFICAAVLGALFLGGLRFWKYSLIFAGAIFIGLWYCHAYLDWKTTHEKFPASSDSFTAVIADEPKISGNLSIFPAALQHPFSGTITVFASGTFRYGDLIETKGAIRPGQDFGEGPVVFPRTVMVFGAHRGFWLREWMLDVKAAIAAKFGEFLSPDGAALLGGMTFGGTNGMSKPLKDEMAASGTSYVASMYGYKIFVIAWAVEQALKHYVMRRKRFMAATACMLLFVAMAGASAMVLRAAIIAFLVLLSREIGRALSKRNALALVAAGMALFDPTIVVQVGFTLSFLSVAGLLYLEQPLRRFWGWEKKKSGILKWRESTLMAVAVLLAIIPAIVADSGKEFSLAIFLSNALIGIGMPFAIGFGYALAFAGFVSPYLGWMVAKLGSVVLWYDFMVIKIFSAFTVPLPFKFDSIAPFAVYYAAIGWFAYSFRDKEPAGGRA